jgi:hypothetical protein
MRIIIFPVIILLYLISARSEKASEISTMLHADAQNTASHFNSDL